MSTQPDFVSMTQHELRNYVLANRDDKRAFQVYIDRLHSRRGQSQTHTADTANS